MVQRSLGAVTGQSNRAATGQNVPVSLQVLNYKCVGLNVHANRSHFCLYREKRRTLKKLIGKDLIGLIFIVPVHIQGLLWTFIQNDFSIRPLFHEILELHIIYFTGVID